MFKPINIRNASDLVIDGTGVKLVLTVLNLVPILIARSRNVTVDGNEFSDLGQYSQSVVLMAPDQPD